MKWYYWLIVIGVLVVFYILLIARQKRQEKQNLENLNSFKVGDKVVTHIGVFGKIKRIYNTTYGKICVLEVGVNNKVDIEMDLRFVAAIDEKTIAPEDPRPEIQAPKGKEQNKAETEVNASENLVNKDNVKKDNK